MEKGNVDLRVTFYEDEEDGGWIGACPEIGVYTQGETREEAVANLYEAMDGWFLDCLEHGDLEWALCESGALPFVNPSSTQGLTSYHV